MGTLMFLLLAAVVGLIVQVGRLRAESAETTKKVLAEVSRVRADGARVQGYLLEVSQSLGPSSDPVPALAGALKEVADQFLAARAEADHSALAVCDALQTATDAHLRAVQEFEHRGARVVAGIERASGAMTSVSVELRDTTTASAELHEALRANAVSFQMVQELIGRLDDLMPQVSASSQSLVQLIERVEEKNLFGERVFVDFERALKQLSDAVVDLAALSRTFAIQLDHQPHSIGIAPILHDAEAEEPAAAHRR